MLSTDAKLRELVNRLKEFAATNLECVILYGSGARGDFRPGHSDLNVVCVLHALTIEELARKYDLQPPWFVLPGPHDRWEPYRLLIAMP